MRSKFHSFFLYSLALWLLFTVVLIPACIYFTIYEADGFYFHVPFFTCFILGIYYLAVTRFRFQTLFLGDRLTITRWPLYKSISVEYADIAYAEVQQRTEEKEGYHYVGKYSITRKQSPTRIARRGLIVLKNGIQISLPDTTYSNIEEMIAYIESRRTL